MRRLATLCTLCVLLAAAAAQARPLNDQIAPGSAASVGVAKKQRFELRRHVLNKAAQRRRRGHAGAARRRHTLLSASTTVLFGDSAVEASLDNNTAGWAEAFPFSNGTGGTVSSVSVYVDSHNKATKLTAGLYADSNGQPTSLLTSGSISSVNAGAWNIVPLSSVSVGSGSRYWLAILGGGGKLYFRDRSNGPCTSENSYQTSLSSLPSSWTAGPAWTTCPVSAYVNGYPSSTAPTSSAPTNTALPVVTGNASQGTTLSTSNGSWANSPTTYSYQWQDCAGSGGSCTNIGGATASSYTLASGDVGYTVRSVVTATNAAGSSAASSAPTAVVAASVVAPSNTALPAVSGSDVQGQVLSTSNGAWSGSPTSYGYQWEDCNSSGSSCVNISGATSSSYTLQSSDVGDTIRSVVTATNSAGVTAAQSAATGVVAAPSQTATMLVGNSAMASLADWDSAGSAEAFQFKAAASGTTSTADVYVDPGTVIGSLIAGLYSNNNGHPGTLLASGSTTAITAGQWNKFNVSGTSVTGGATYWIAVLSTGGMLNFMDNDPGSGSCSESSSQTTLTSLPSSWTSGPSYTSCGASAYISTAGTATAAPSSTTLPVVSGSDVQGQALSTSNGSWSGSPTSYGYQWEDCNSSGGSCVNISGATSSSYTLQSSDVGDTIRAAVTATNSGGSTLATSTQTAAVTATVTAPSNTALPAVSGSDVKGQVLSTSKGSWSGGPTSYAYQWEECNSSGTSCVNISGATSSSYTLQSTDVGDTLRSVVTASNSAGSSSATSSATAVVTQPVPPSNTTAPAVTGTAQQGSVLTAANGTWSGDTPMTYAYQWQQDGTTNISGATSSTYTAQASDVGHALDVVVTATNDAGSASAKSNSTSAVVASAGLPSGVSLQQIDGGLNYFSKFSSVPAAWSTANFFPIGAWNEPFPASGDGTDIAAYKNEGVNGFVALANGYTSTLLSQLSQNGMWFINYEGGLNSSVPTAGPMVGRFWADEADGNPRCSDIPTAAALGEAVPCTNTTDNRTPASAIAQATSDYHGAHGAGDPTRFVYGQYTKPVSLDQGLTSSQAAAYENAVDVISYDHYIINDSWNPGPLWQQYDEVQTVRAQDNDAKPVWPFIEAPSPFAASQWSGVTATPAMIVAEAWNAIIGGARGIEYFDTDFCGSACGYPGGGMTLASTNSGYAALQSAIKSFDNEVATLAPIINDPFANGYVLSSVTNSNKMNVMAKYDQSSNKFYVFAAPRFNSSQTATYTVAGGYTGPVTVYGENRTVQATNGVFSDAVAGQTAVHIYVIPG